MMKTVSVNGKTGATGTSLSHKRSHAGQILWAAVQGSPQCGEIYVAEARVLPQLPVRVVAHPGIIFCFPVAAEEKGRLTWKLNWTKWNTFPHRTMTTDKSFGYLKNLGWCVALLSSSALRLSLCSCSILCFCSSAASRLPSSSSLRGKAHAHSLCKHSPSEFKCVPHFFVFPGFASFQRDDLIKIGSFLIP